uniref:Sugar phosphate transporter domain-containing protein n=1 Tax=Globisporangium ultimum (strain ATCC 200006 / CBS 805.95 / DAOM BR144) TaxID=431595 RepID=K3W546_GLOUD
MILGFASMQIVNMPITLGSVIAGSTDVTSDVTGYVLVLLQNLCSAFSLTFSKESALSSMELVLLNSTAGSLICSLLAFHREHDAVMAFSYLYDAQFLAIVGVMCCVCVLYQFSIFLCTIHNSALATSVTGNVKDLISTVCGFLFFPDVQVRVGNVAGVMLSFLGAYSFSYLKYRALTHERNKLKQT